MKDVVRTTRDAFQFVANITFLNGEKPYTIELKPFRRKQTQEQQAYFHVLCREYAKILKHEHGIDTNMEGIKEFMKDEYAPTERYITPDGKGRARPMSSSKWNLEQTSEMIDHLIQHAAEREIILE